MTTENEQLPPSASNVLLLGCGDIARRLAPRLSQQGLSCSGLRRTKTESTEHIHYQRADASSRTEMTAVLNQGFEVVVITLTPSEYSDEGYRRGYVEPVQVLANIYAENPLKAPKLVLFVSSSGVYAHDDGVWVDEGSSTESQRYNGKRLLEAEQLLAGSAIPSIAVRFSGIYGPGRNRLIKQAREKVWSETDQSKWTNRIHVDDCAGVLAHLIERYQQGKNLDSIYLASDSEPVSSWDVKQWLAQQQDAIEEQELSHYSGVMSNKRCSNQRLLDSGYEFIYPTYREGYRQVLSES